MQKLTLEELSEQYSEFRANYVQFLYIINHPNTIHTCFDDIYYACVKQLMQLREANYIDGHQYVTLCTELLLKKKEHERRYYW